MKLINKLMARAKRLEQKQEEQEIQYDYTLVYDFEICKNAILERNKEEIINKLIPAIRKEYQKYQGLLICDEQARSEALQIFNTGKETGDIDVMNKYVGGITNGLH